LLAELPTGVELVAAAKGRTATEVCEAIQAGIKIIGENFIQEADSHISAIGNKARWHFIGALQHNKVKLAAMLFDMVETIDSIKIARSLDRQCSILGKTMPVLIEINSGREPQKSGIGPERLEALLDEMSGLRHVRVMGLMTMGPRFGDPEQSRPYFIATRRLFETVNRQCIPNINMKYLSMGMSNSYRIAIEEGANIVRIGTMIFENRDS
jgi:pyridoxal phosphate enzyme (YggS family)